ncbi:uncharacterized protein LOC116208918 [Punica granatum]|uniref:Uncharacterized protein LOC116208918 n=1 Tax=Punica granatum TaxID=22663 RepID=A0A6P8DYR3_PUNGR|nr:uncharacterized protein LOC116208918 [Punica granatum]
MRISTKGGTGTGTGNGKQRSSSSENWDTGFLLVFFPEEETHHTPPPPPSKLLPCSPSSSYTPSPSPSAAARSSNGYGVSPSSSFRRSSSYRLLAKAQSTISICALLVFITLLVFTLSTFEHASTPVTAPRRFLSQTAGARSPPGFRFSNLWGHSNFTKPQFALQGMGTLYRRGTRAMNDLVVAHVTETATEDEVRLFLRALHRSALMARADLVLILSSRSPGFDAVIREENDSFLRLVLRYGELNGPSARKRTPLGGFDVTQFVRPVKSKEKEVAEPLWGKRMRSNYSDSDGEGELTRLSYGSVVSFEAAELDPENSLAGFLDHVPMSLRRWACYQMLLGRVRRNFKHVMLVDVRSSVVLGDPLGRVRSRSPESVYLLNKPDGNSPRHGRKNSDKNQGGHSPVNSGMIMGGARGVRRLAAAMLTEVVRAAMQHKKKSSVTESAVLSQLAGNEFLLRNVELVRANEPPAPEPGSTGSSSSEFAVIQRGNSLSGLIMKQICSCETDSSVYKDC